MIEINRLKIRLLFLLIFFIGLTGCSKEAKSISKDYDKNSIKLEE